MERSEILKKIKRIEEEIKKTPYHKGTEHHIGKLRAKLARLREQLMAGSAKKKGGAGFALKKQGDATVVFLGFPSVGKSTLLNKLTNARSKIAPYAFTTVSVIPGMIRYKGAYIQLLDLPGIIEQAAAGRGRGREILSVVRNADLVLLISEVGQEKQQFSLIEKELSFVGILLNQEKFDERIYLNLPALYLVNKIDLRKEAQLRQGLPADKAGRAATHLNNHLNNIYYLSAKTGEGLKALKEAIWQKLKLKRIYLRKKGERPDFAKPLIVKKEAKIKEIAQKVSQSLAEEVRGAKIWQGNAKYPGQEVGLDFCPADRTIVYLKS